MTTSTNDNQPTAKRSNTMNKLQAKDMDWKLTYGRPWEVVDSYGNVVLTIDSYYHDGFYQCTWPDGARAVLHPGDMPDGVLRCVGPVDHVRLADQTTGVA